MNIIDRYIQEKSFFRGKKAIGVTVDFQTSGAMLYTVLSVKRERTSVHKDSEIKTFSDKEIFFSSIDITAPICLTITGTKIVHREMNISDDQSDSDILNAIFPNASINDFYLQKDELNNSRYLISVIRKEVLDNIVDECKTKNILVVATDIGIAAFSSILHILPESNEYRCGYFLIKMSGQTMVSCEKTTEIAESKYEIGTDSFPSTCINAYAQSVFFLSAADGLESFQYVRSERDAFLYKAFIKQAGIILASSLFAILLINFFLFDNYYKRHNELESTLNQNKDLLIKLDTLKNDLKTKEELFKESGFIHPSRLSFYADHIAASLPESIILDELHCIPLEKKLKQDQEIAVKQNCILVSGSVNASSELNEWIGLLGKESWIKSVTIVSYLQDNNFTRGDFQITITIKE